MLLHGPSGWGKKKDFVKGFDGPCQIITAWRRHRDELMAAGPMCKRPYAFWMVERRLKQRPAGEAGELRLIKQLDLYRDDAEKEFVLRRLSEITAELRSHWHAAWPGPSRPRPQPMARKFLSPVSKLTRSTQARRNSSWRKRSDNGYPEPIVVPFPPQATIGPIPLSCSYKIFDCGAGGKIGPRGIAQHTPPYQIPSVSM